MNHLKGETSPYLLQHVNNPVDWYPWGREALDRARSEGKPVFLSIGYSACHWCHVMERESFEDPVIAEFLNENFVSIKVDREERPDIDEIYMNAVQLMTGGGGWPLTAFITPDLEPFFTGTYFPPHDLHGRPGFLSLLQGISKAWSEKRDDVVRSAAELASHLGRIAEAGGETGPGGTIGENLQLAAVADLTRRFDARWGGFGGAPKFPPDGALALLMREHLRSGERIPLQIVERTLDAMAFGGMYDHVGGGFARYSVDDQWLVPHFEKMLYNQALLVPLYVDAWKLTKKPLYRRVVEESLSFVRRELTATEGGFLSSLDADSEGVEGKFYVWSPDEVRSTLDAAEAELFCELYDVTEQGNFEGSNIPNLIAGSLEDQAASRGLDAEQWVDRMRDAKAKLLAARGSRVRPGTDDKVLTAWNGLMISAFARAYQALGLDADLSAARGAADFARNTLMREGRLLVTYRDGQAKLNAYLDDYAFLGRGLLDLYETCFDVDYLLDAERLARALVDHFEDSRQGGFFFVSDDHEQLLTRNRSLHDGALPSGAGVAAEFLLRVATHLDDASLREVATRALESYQPVVTRSPAAFAATLIAADLARGPMTEIAIVGELETPATRDLLAIVHEAPRPRLALAAGQGTTRRRLPLLADRDLIDGRPAAYLCRDYACQAPTDDPAELRRQLKDG
jgi:uncharacterized protein YyaL (SSP411 family)